MSAYIVFTRTNSESDNSNTARCDLLDASCLGQYRGEMSPVAASPLVRDRDISMLDEGKEVGLCLPHRKHFLSPVARKKDNGGRNVWQEGRLKVVGVFP